MKVLFAARDGVEGRWLAAYLAQQKLIDAMLFESGGPARSRKLKRHFSCSPLLWPSRALDLIALQKMSAKVSNSLKQRLTPLPEPSIQSHVCEDVNDSHAAAVLGQMKPDLVLIFGTALLNRHTLQLAPLFLNIHGGLVPRYRNVHSEFWALKENRTDEIGSSILRVTEGIDNGDVVLKAAIDPKGVTDLAEARFKNFLLGAELAAQALSLWRQGKLTSQPQTKEQSRHLKTPGWRDIWG